MNPYMPDSTGSDALDAQVINTQMVATLSRTKRSLTEFHLVLLFKNNGAGMLFFLVQI